MKLLSIAFLWLTISFAIAFVATTWWLKTILLFVAVGVTIHLSFIKTWRQESHSLVEPGKPKESIDVS